MDGCETMEVWLSLRLDGMLEPEEERELEAHLAVCPSCRALARELEAMHTAFPQLEDCPAPEGFAEGVMERIDALEEKKPKVVPLFRRPQVRALMGLAACAVLCIGLYRGGMFTQEADLAAETENVGRCGRRHVPGGGGPLRRRPGCRGGAHGPRQPGNARCGWDGPGGGRLPKGWPHRGSASGRRA